MQTTTKKFVGGLVIGSVIGALVGISIYATLIVNAL